MMEENNDIFLAGCDALMYLARPMHKKYPTTFVLGDVFSQYLPILGPIFQPPFPLVRVCTHFRVTATTVALFQKIL